MERTTREEAALLAKYSRRKDSTNIEKEVSAIVEGREGKETEAVKELVEEEGPSTSNSSRVGGVPRLLRNTSSTILSWDSFQDETSAICNRRSMSPTRLEDSRSVSSQKLPPLHPNSFSYSSRPPATSNGRGGSSSRHNSNKQQPRVLSESKSYDGIGRSGGGNGMRRVNSDNAFHHPSGTQLASASSESSGSDDSTGLLPDTMEVRKFLHELAENRERQVADLDYNPIWIQDVLKRGMGEAAQCYTGGHAHNDLLSGVIVSNTTIHCNTNNKQAVSVYFTMQDAVGQVIQICCSIPTTTTNNTTQLFHKNLKFFRKNSKNNSQKIKNLELQFYKGRAISIRNPILDHYWVTPETQMPPIIRVQSNREDDIMDILVPHHLPDFTKEREKNNSKRVLHWQLLGDEFMMIQNYAAAMESYEKALTSTNNSHFEAVSSLFSSRAYAYIKLNLYALALRDATAAHRINPNNYKAPYRILVSLMRLILLNDNSDYDHDVMQAAEQLRLQSIHMFPSQYTQPYIALGQLHHLPQHATTSFNYKHNILISHWLQKYYFVETLRYPINYSSSTSSSLLTWNECKNLGNRSCVKGQFNVAIEQYTTALDLINDSSTNTNTTTNTNTNTNNINTNCSIINLLTKRTEAALRIEAYEYALQDSTTAIIINNLFVKPWGFRTLAIKGIQNMLHN